MTVIAGMIIAIYMLSAEGGRCIMDPLAYAEKKGLEFFVMPEFFSP
jgi:hypothetical protein